MANAYLVAVRALATDGEFRAEFRADAEVALSRRRLRLRAEQVGALREVFGESDGETPTLVKAIGRPRGWWQFSAEPTAVVGVA